MNTAADGTSKSCEKLFKSDSNANIMIIFISEKSMCASWRKRDGRLSAGSKTSALILELRHTWQ